MNALSILRIDAAMRGNRIIFWMGRLPLIRRLISDTLYSAKEGKLAVSVLLWIWRAFKSLFGTALYVAAMCVLPLLPVVDPSSLHLAFGRFCWLIFVLSFLTGSLLKPCSVAANPLKYTCVRMMSMDARSFHFWDILKSLANYLITFSIVLMIAAVVFGQSALTGLLLTAELLCARVIFEWLHVLIYDRTGKALYGRVWFVLTVIFGGLAAAYFPSLAFDMQTQNWLLSAPAVLLFLLIGAICAILLLRYPRWYRLTVDTCTADRISPDLAKEKQQAAGFSDVKLKDSDLTSEGDCSGPAGWSYLQAIFFRRHSRMMYKPLKYILIGIGAITVVACILLRIFRSANTSDVFSQITHTLPFCVFFLYLIQSNIMGNRICKAMFYNCDLAMLKFGWYRSPKVILQNFALRLRRICAVNLLMSVALCVMFTAMVLCAEGRPPLPEYLAFSVSLLTLAIFFSVHSLGMYYLFQPYTTDLKMKNPFFATINAVMYAVCYACIQIRSTPIWFTPVVLAVTAVYSTVILLFVWKRAPRTFRVK